MKNFIYMLIFISCATISFGTQMDFSQESIKLLKPNLHSGKNIMETLNERKSSRDFTDITLTLEEVSEILWAANGINREDGKRTSPSAMGVYSVDIYAVFKNGIYKYNPVDETITLTAKGDHRTLAGMQDFVFIAPLNLIYITDMSKYEKFTNIDKEKLIFFSGQDAASYAENVNIYTAGKGMKSITRGGAKWEELFKVLNLDKEKYHFVLAQSVGK